MSTPVNLATGEHIDVIVGGRTIRVSAEQDGDGGDFVQLGGVDCNLEGEQPGIYYLAPLDASA